MDYWIWALILLLVGMAFAVLEVFVPSGTLFGFLGFFSIVGAVTLAFMEGPTAGFVVLGTAILGLPVVIVVALAWWPRTAMGRRVLLQVPTSDQVLPENRLRPVLEALVGRVGYAKCLMLPSGIIQIENQNYDAMSEGMPIEAGQRVRVIDVRGNRLVVEGIADDAVLEGDSDPLAGPVEWDVPPPSPPPA
jgi:membrane-bound serine protease (ClpP class)